MKEETDSQYQLRKQRDETADNLTSGSPILEKNECVMRHGKICAHLHYSVRKALNIETTEKWHTHTHTHTPKPVCQQEDVTVLWHQGMHTNREFMQIGQI